MHNLEDHVMKQPVREVTKRQMQNGGSDYSYLIDRDKNTEKNRVIVNSFEPQITIIGLLRNKDYSIAADNQYMAQDFIQ